jgi:hypothetical protein
MPAENASTAINRTLQWTFKRTLPGAQTSAFPGDPPLRQSLVRERKQRLRSGPDFGGGFWRAGEAFGAPAAKEKPDMQALSSNTFTLRGPLTT